LLDNFWSQKPGVQICNRIQREMLDPDLYSSKNAGSHNTAYIFLRLCIHLQYLTFYVVTFSAIKTISLLLPKTIVAIRAPAYTIIL
jgi:hypothetical protein